MPSLFRKVSDWKKAHKIRTTSLWNAVIDPSYAPWPIRRFLSLLRNRDATGDLWNMCHFWSNFEIADMDFFRSPEYRKFFDFLDANGGFYFERVSEEPRFPFSIEFGLSSQLSQTFLVYARFCWFSSSVNNYPDLKKKYNMRRRLDPLMKCYG